MPDAEADQASPEGADQKPKKDRKQKKEKKEKKKHKKEKKEKKSKQQEDGAGSSGDEDGNTRQEQQRIEDELRQKALLSARRRESSDD